MLVIDSGRTRSDVCRRAVETLSKTKVKVYGVVLNRLAQRRAAGYYYYYYEDSHERKPRSNRHQNGHEPAI
jgi:Mrp family chromosome partitioning ATPase